MDPEFLIQAVSNEGDAAERMSEIRETDPELFDAYREQALDWGCDPLDELLDIYLGKERPWTCSGTARAIRRVSAIAKNST